MSNRLKINLKRIFMYAAIVYVLLIPFKMWVAGISISMLIGFFFGQVNEIIIQLRKLNGEKLDSID